MTLQLGDRALLQQFVGFGGCGLIQRTSGALGGTAAGLVEMRPVGPPLQLAWPTTFRVGIAGLQFDNARHIAACMTAHNAAAPKGVLKGREAGGEWLLPAPYSPCAPMRSCQLDCN